MGKQTSKTLIGGFVVGAVALIVAGVLIFGSGKFFQQSNQYVLYFRGSLKGLNVGAPVLYQGVQVGSVIDITIEADAEDQTSQIPVTIEILPKKFKVIRGKRASDPYESLPLLIERGLRAQLQQQSFVTGQLMIGLDYYPDTPVRLVGIDTEYPEIPTIPTPFETLSRTFRDLNLQELVNRVTSAVKGIEELVNSPDLKGSVNSLHLALEDTRKLIGNINNQVGPLAGSIDNTVKDYGKLARNVDSQVKPVASNVNRTVKDIGQLARDLDRQTDPVMFKIEEALKEATLTMKQAQKTLAVAEADLSEDSPTMYELNNALREISAMARSIRQLADYLKRHPEALLSGKGEGGGK
jgi:paraquat-inducible protein B